MAFSCTRHKSTLLGAAGSILHCIDRFCTFLYLAGAMCFGGTLVWMAFTETLWLLLLAVPALLTTALFLLSFLRCPALGL